MRQFMKSMEEYWQRRALDMMNQGMDPLTSAGLQNAATSSSYEGMGQTRFVADDLYRALDMLKPNCTVRASEYCKEGDLLFADTQAIPSWVLPEQRGPRYLLIGRQEDLTRLGLSNGEELHLTDDMIARLQKRGDAHAAGEGEGTPRSSDR